NYLSSAEIVDFLTREVNTLTHKRRLLPSDRERLAFTLEQIARRGSLPVADVARLRKMLDAGDLRSLRYQLARTLSYLSGTERHLIQERIEELSLENARLREMISEQRTRLEAGLETSQESEKERAEDVEKEENMLEKFNSASNRVFVIMPFKDDFSDVWNGGIRRACQETKFAPLRVDEIKMSSGITDD